MVEESRLLKTLRETIRHYNTGRYEEAESDQVFALGQAS